jgi:hypothetical protein
MDDVRQPGRFVWERYGRQYVTRFGNLSAHVVIHGSKAKGTQAFYVGDIFGHGFLGSGKGRSLDDAILEAEPIIIREASALKSAVRRMDTAGAPRPAGEGSAK